MAASYGRLVLDLSRSVNPFVRKFKFKYESLPTLAVMFRDNFWFFTFDIESGYHHLDINYNCWKYLGFSWSTDGVEKYFVFRVLHFGLSSACHLFTKMFKPLVARWRSLGIFAILYIDDGIFGCRTLPDAQSASKLVKSDLLNSGWRCNEKKSFNGYPINRPLSSSAVLTCDASETGYGAHVVFYNERKFCSGMWNELQGCMSSSYRELMAVLLALKSFQSFIAEKKVTIFVVPEKKIVKLKSILTELINDFPNFKVRRVASVSGFVISLSVALGPVARLFTRQMYFFHQLEAILERRTCRKRRSFTRIEIFG